jgi:hypothetical protein
VSALLTRLWCSFYDWGPAWQVYLGTFAGDVITWRCLGNYREEEMGMSYIILLIDRGNCFVIEFNE